MKTFAAVLRITINLDAQPINIYYLMGFLLLSVINGMEEPGCKLWGGSWLALAVLTFHEAAFFINISKEH